MSMSRQEIESILDKLTDIEAGCLDRMAYKAGYYKSWLSHLICESQNEQNFLLKRFLEATTGEKNVK